MSQRPHPAMPAPGAAAAPILEATGIAKAFGGLKALQGCSIAVGRGSITGLIGPNGAGKSTLFNIVAGFIRPDRGMIVLDGAPVTGLAPHQLFRRGLVRTFQIPHELARMSVLDNLMVVPPQPVGESLVRSWFRWAEIQAADAEIRAKAEDALAFLRLTHLRDELAGNLSGGQKKLLELGRTLMTDAKLVLLDEIGAGVNPTLLAEISGLIERLNRERGYTFWVIEHDMDLIARLCQPVIVMAEGRVLFQGTMEEVKRNEAVVEAYFGGRRAAMAAAAP